jgi:dihydroxyacetone kinase-like predicted kinase
LITLITGADAEETRTAELMKWIDARFPEVELEVHTGGQPLYPYLVGVE